MEYRVVEIEKIKAAVIEAVEIARFDSAYDAVELMRHARDAGDRRVWNWYLLDDRDRILFGPDDLNDYEDAA